ncbi:1881_t:CDS:2, partial [Dentiscutata erythropus]
MTSLPVLNHDSDHDNNYNNGDENDYENYYKNDYEDDPNNNLDNELDNNLDNDNIVKVFLWKWGSTKTLWRHLESTNWSQYVTTKACNKKKKKVQDEHSTIKEIFKE